MVEHRVSVHLNNLDQLSYKYANISCVQEREKSHKTVSKWRSLLFYSYFPQKKWLIITQLELWNQLKFSSFDKT